MPLTNSEYLMSTNALQRRADRLRASDKPSHRTRAQEIDAYLIERQAGWDAFMRTFNAIRPKGTRPLRR